MDYQNSSPSGRDESPRPRTHRHRSNSFPIVEALGCSTPEAQLMLAEGRAAVRSRRSRGRRNRSVNDTNITTFDPRDHLDFLNGPSPAKALREQSSQLEPRTCHARQPSDASDRSTATVVPPSYDGEHHARTSPMSPLGNYSANLAQFIKDQLKNIPTYTPGSGLASPQSPRSCPDLSSCSRTPPQSPNQAIRRPVDAPKIIEIPPIRPPVQSQFSAWSSADDTDDDVPPLPDVESVGRDAMPKSSHYTPSVLSYYETSDKSSFLFPSTPMEEDNDPDTAKGLSFPTISPTLPSENRSPAHDDDDYPSSGISRPQLTSSSAPSFASSISTTSYFDYKRPMSFTPHMRDRIIAAVTPPAMQGKILTAISPWEGAALSNVHDVCVESQHRVHVDGMSFDMQRDFVMPSHIGTPC